MMCKGRRDQILLYLTDGLDSADREDLETHLQEGCPYCLAELWAGRELTGWLPLALHPERPREAVKNHLMERVRSQLELPTTGSDVSESADQNLPDKPNRISEQKPDHEDGPSNWRWKQRSIFVTVGMPLIIAATAIAATYGVMRMELRAGDDRFADLAEEVATLKQDLTSRDARLVELKSLADMTQSLWTSLRSHQSLYVQLEGTRDDHLQWARLLVDIDRRLCFFFPGEPQPLEVDQRYALWFESEDEGEPILAAEFTVGDRGPTWFELRLPDEPRQFTTVSVGPLAGDKEAAHSLSRERVLFGTLGGPVW